ncbi:hypothetical protein [Pararhizobium arenae]|uniref:hypothetical protein n=1 Tax=Pararhizobium arenae TaxID=1856850 RepID=UPI00094A9F84|nr:hypothetical protein [Pararhizobium arenae]
MVDIVAGMGMLAQAIGIAKDIREIDRGLDQGEIKAKMADLYSALADAKMAFADAQGEMKAREEEIARLQEAFKFRSTLAEYHGFKYEAFEDGSPRGRPFCPRCEENHGRFYRLTRFGKGMLNMMCPECKTEYANVSNFAWDKQA